MDKALRLLLTPPVSLLLGLDVQRRTYTTLSGTFPGEGPSLYIRLTLNVIDPVSFNRTLVMSLHVRGSRNSAICSCERPLLVCQRSSIPGVFTRIPEQTAATGSVPGREPMPTSGLFE